MATFSLPRGKLSAAFSEVELDRLEASDRHERAHNIARRAQLLGMGPSYASLFDLVTANANEMIDGRLYWVETEPTEQALNDLIADITLMYEAHIATIGTVHGAADAVNTILANGGAAIYVPGNLAAARTQLNAIKAAFNAHAPYIVAATHIAATNEDLCLQADVAVGDKTGAWLLANALRTQLAAHEASVVSHTTADAVNLVTTDPVSGSSATNDVKALYRWSDTLTTTLEGDRVFRLQGIPAANAGRFTRADLANDAESSLGGAYTNLFSLVSEDPGNLRDGGLYWVGLSPSMLALNLLIADLTLQYEAHRVDAAAHIGADGVNTIVASGGAAVYVLGNVAAAATQLNAIQTAYNAHCGTAAAVHTAADAVNVSTEAAAGASDLIGLWRLANELRADYEAHRIVSPAVHPAADVTAVVTATAISAASSTTEILHTYQWQPDATDTPARLTIFPLVAARATGRFVRVNLASYMGQGPNPFHAFTASNLDYLRFQDGQLYELHNFTSLYQLEIACLDLWTMYEAHRILIGGGEHLGADGVNALVAYVPTDLKSHSDMLVDFKAKFNAHIITTAGPVHANADLLNGVTFPDITDYDLFGAWALYNACWTAYEAHRVYAGAGIEPHPVADGTNVMTQPRIDATTDWNVIDGTYRWEENTTTVPNNLQILQLPLCPDGGRLVAQRGDETRCMGELVAPGVNYIAQYTGGAPIDDALGPWTMPTPRRNVRIVCSAVAFVACVGTVTGTDADGNVIDETFALSTGATLVGRRIFHTITRVQTSLDIGAGDTIDVQTGERIYIGPFAEMLGVAADEVDETATSLWIGQEGMYEAATVQNANVVFHVMLQALR